MLTITDRDRGVVLIVVVVYMCIVDITDLKFYFQYVLQRKPFWISDQHKKIFML